MAIPVPFDTIRRHIQVTGIVQGVGFRPFVYNLAKTLGLVGYVFNSSSGVTIEIEGSRPSVEQFVSTLTHHPPPLAQIADIAIRELEPQGGGEFSIHESRRQEGEFVLVSPDVATCEDCWSDVGDRNNRRYGYPFTNCTNCGPRYTIIQDIPYDRAKTTMGVFSMCERCQQEYTDPTNRRFHAQPNACPVCGPSLALIEQGSSFGVPAFDSRHASLSILHQVREQLRDGRIVAVKGLGGFLLACDAANDASVRLLRKRKRRSDKPFALMARDLASVESFCLVSEADRKALVHSRRPIVVLPRKPGSTLPAALAPGNETLGVMLPYTPLHYLLFSDSPEEPTQFPALVMTSGNLSEEPIVISNEEAWQRLGGVADTFLFHNRDIYMRADDSVVRTFEGRERVLRRSRGYVPHAIELDLPFQELLAFGGELKNTLCLTKDRYAILSQHIGDLENYETMVFFQETLRNLKKLFRVEPRAVAYDLHPGYMSTRLALEHAAESGLEHAFGVQHHHAHIASCMAENHLRDKVIGVAFDGTGYGTDGAIWGGEFLIADFVEFERRAHFRYVPLPGGDAAVRHPWRMAVSYLRDALGSVPENLTCLQEVPAAQIKLVEQMIAKQINTAQTSSCGRLFDAVAALVGLGSTVSFEGQAAISLEAIAATDITTSYEYEIETAAPLVVDFRKVITAITSDLGRGKPAAEISARFHNTICAVIVDVCQRLRESDGLEAVCLSGGTFQNMYLLEHAVAELRRSGFSVYLHSAVPCNDGGLSLGQAVIANQRLREGK
jgi:hydrogenase maturation protein HypF